MPVHSGPSHADHPEPKYRKRRGRFLRFVRGYLMIVGGMTTLYGLIQLLVLLFVEMAKWAAVQPMM